MRNLVTNLPMKQLLFFFFLSLVTASAAPGPDIEAEPGSRFSTNELGDQVRIEQGAFKIRCLKQTRLDCRRQAIICERGRYLLFINNDRAEFRVVDGEANLQLSPRQTKSLKAGQSFTWKSKKQEQMELLQSMGMCE